MTNKTENAAPVGAMNDRASDVELPYTWARLLTGVCRSVVAVLIAANFAVSWPTEIASVFWACVGLGTGDLPLLLPHPTTNTSEHTMNNTSTFFMICLLLKFSAWRKCNGFPAICTGAFSFMGQGDPFGTNFSSIRYICVPRSENCAPIHDSSFMSRGEE